MKIEPRENIVYLKIDGAKGAVLDTSSRPSAVEFAEVIDFGENVKGFKKGDRIFVKAWAIDIVDHEDTKYHFVNINTGGILAIVK